MKESHFVLKFSAAALGALTLGAVLAAGFDGVEPGNASKGQTQAHKGPVRVDKQLPAVQKVEPKSNMADKALKGSDKAIKQ